jgi:hypothetical protein
LLQVVSSSCEELTLPFLVVVCWNFGWFFNHSDTCAGAIQSLASDHASKKARGAKPSPGLVPLPLPSLRYSTVLPSPGRYGKRYEVRLYTSRVDEVSEGFDGTQDILTVWTSSTNQS